MHQDQTWRNTRPETFFQETRLKFWRLVWKARHDRCLSILHKTKKEHFHSLNIKQVSHNKLFWKSVKPSFSDKGSNSSKITLVEENNIISDEEEIANTMNNYFINVTKPLNLKKQHEVGRSGVNKFENILLALKWSMTNVLKYFRKALNFS